MSKQNKVNPGTYTQRGRLTQDDAARELRKQSAFGFPHTWQPVTNNVRPRPSRPGDARRGAESAVDDAGPEEALPVTEARPRSPVRKKKTTTPAARAKLSKTAKPGAAAKAVRRTKTAKPTKRVATKRTVRVATKRKATAGRSRKGAGAGPKSRSTPKRPTR